MAIKLSIIEGLTESFPQFTRKLRGQYPFSKGDGEGFYFWIILILNWKLTLQLLHVFCTISVYLMIILMMVTSLMGMMRIMMLSSNTQMLE